MANLDMVPWFLIHGTGKFAKDEIIAQVVTDAQFLQAHFSFHCIEGFHESRTRDVCPANVETRELSSSKPWWTTRTGDCMHWSKQGLQRGRCSSIGWICQCCNTQTSCRAWILVMFRHFCKLSVCTCLACLEMDSIVAFVNSGQSFRTSVWILLCLVDRNMTRTWVSVRLAYPVRVSSCSELVMVGKNELASRNVWMEQIVKDLILVAYCCK